MKINVKVKPNSKFQEVSKENNLFVVRLTAKPVGGEANKELIRLLADYFKTAKSNIIIKSGLKSREKIVEILF